MAFAIRTRQLAESEWQRAYAMGMADEMASTATPRRASPPRDRATRTTSPAARTRPTTSPARATSPARTRRASPARTRQTVGSASEKPQPSSDDMQTRLAFTPGAKSAKPRSASPYKAGRTGTSVEQYTSNSTELKAAAAAANLTTFGKAPVEAKATKRAGRQPSPGRQRVKERLNTPFGFPTPLGAPSQNLVNDAEHLWAELQEERRLRRQSDAMWAERLNNQEAINTGREELWSQSMARSEQLASRAVDRAAEDQERLKSHTAAMFNATAMARHPAHVHPYTGHVHALAAADAYGFPAGQHVAPAFYGQQPDEPSDLRSIASEVAHLSSMPRPFF